MVTWLKSFMVKGLHGLLFRVQLSTANCFGFDCRLLTADCFGFQVPSFGFNCLLLTVPGLTADCSVFLILWILDASYHTLAPFYFCLLP